MVTLTRELADQITDVVLLLEKQELPEEALRRLLVELHWTRMVAEVNKVATAELDLHRHLFGSDRIIPPKPLRDGIAAPAAGWRVVSGQVQVDRLAPSQPGVADREDHGEVLLPACEERGALGE